MALSSATHRGACRLAMAVLAALFAIVAPSRADELDRRVRDLLAWVAEETGYDAGGIEVTVEFAEPRVLNIVGYGTSYIGQSDIEAVSIGRAILLPDWFELGRNDDVLVHELTHVLQFTNDAQFD